MVMRGAATNPVNVTSHTGPLKAWDVHSKDDCTATVPKKTPGPQVVP